MTEEDYKEDVKHWVKTAEIYTPGRLFVDDRDMKFLISPEFQNWINQNLIVPGIKYGMRKVAFLESPEIFAQVSVEQLMDENEDTILKIKYFEDDTKAKEWLLAK